MVFFLLSFLAGVLSVLAACVLPLLPVIIGGSLTAGGSRRRMYVIIGSLAASIVVFTLLLKASTALITIPEATWRYISGGIILVLGILLLFPKLWVLIPGINALNRSSNKLLASGYQRGGLWGDATMGVALGPVFASCSPTYFIILATVLPAQPLLGLVYLIAYAAGLSLALLAIAIAGEKLVQKLGVALDPNGWLYRGIGVVLIVVGILIFTGTMKKIETWLVERGYDTTFIELKFLGSEKKEPASSGTSFVSPEMKTSIYQKSPELVSPDGYINTPSTSSGRALPITIGEFKGKKVVLIDIWTYSCINCQRTLPYLNAWYEKYRDQGLEIIGVHTPEFAFEQVYANVEKAAKGFGLKYPIVLDNEYRTWNAFGNQFWPRKYLIDIDGYIVYDHAGEGNYEETEAAIRRALAERAERLHLDSDMDKTTSEPKDVVTVDGRVGSPEIYFGAERNEYLGNGTQHKTGRQTFTIPEKTYKNALYLGGTWDIAAENAKTVSNAKIQFTYDAKNVYFVAAADSSVRIRVLRDNKPLSNERGEDVDASGYATIKADRLYHLIKGAEYGVHTIEVEIEGAGLEAYTFTFG
ncbi:redoxin family protein [Candidatus Kaiserbacteria bacterium]|nr:redoxin family protein [Candidatus Kaiserbacteria bacterium]